MHAKLLLTMVAGASIAAAAAIPRVEMLREQQPLIARGAEFTRQQLESKKYWDSGADAKLIKFLTEYHNGKRDVAEAQTVLGRDVDADVAEFLRYFADSDADDEDQATAESEGNAEGKDEYH